ncbi:Variable major outer membrane lipoprotein (plasmid) [Borrelia crocidurae DOU]|uniref:Variable major outer membrane lipoprotein n=1 Tax=Borrelia crocidurae DOU TaxID=1293575 RepID=W5SJ59_9SPIR|nr:Variable major outer membrane lipoprotein [Borrelia crocidurae DOU]
MRKMIGIMMVMMMMVGCGQQTDTAGGKSLSEVLLEVGRSTEKAFYTFLELVSDTLGFLG